MTPILERRLDALGRQAVAEAAAPLPSDFMSAVHERQAARAALRTTIACVGLGCFLLSGLAAYMCLPTPVTPDVERHHQVVVTPVPAQSVEVPVTKDPVHDSGPQIQTANTGVGQDRPVVQPIDDHRAPLTQERKDKQR